MGAELIRRRGGEEEPGVEPFGMPSGVIQCA